MPPYIVKRAEVHHSYNEIDAESPEDAIQKVKDGDGDEVCLEYSRTLDEEYTVVTLPSS